MFILQWACCRVNNNHQPPNRIELESKSSNQGEDEYPKVDNDKSFISEDEFLITDSKRRQLCKNESILPQAVYLEPVNEHYTVITPGLYRIAIRVFENTLKKLGEVSLSCVNRFDSKQIEIYRTVVISEIPNWNYAAIFRLSRNETNGQIVIKTIKRVSEGDTSLRKDTFEIPLSPSDLEQFENIIVKADFWNSPRRGDVIRRNPRPHCFFEAVRPEEYKWSSRVGIGKEDKLRTVVEYFLKKVDWDNKANEVLSHLNSVL
jgi:hypothetical protein